MYHIVIVEDDDVQLEIINLMLAEGEYQILAYPHSREFFDHIDDMMSDLILIDLALPDISGFTLCNQLRKIEKFRHTPIIAISADISFHNTTTDKLVSFDDFISKPFAMNEFRRKVMFHLGQASTG